LSAYARARRRDLFVHCHRLGAMECGGGAASASFLPVQPPPVQPPPPVVRTRTANAQAVRNNPWQLRSASIAFPPLRRP